MELHIQLGPNYMVRYSGQRVELTRSCHVTRFDHRVLSLERSDPIHKPPVSSWACFSEGITCTPLVAYVSFSYWWVWRHARSVSDVTFHHTRLWAYIWPFTNGWKAFPLPLPTIVLLKIRKTINGYCFISPPSANP